MKVKPYIFALLMVVMIAPALRSVEAVAPPEARATYTCYFVAPTAGSTVSGSYLVNFYGVYGTAKLYTCKIAVYQNGVAKTSWTTMTHAGSNYWQVTWNTASFADGTGYELRVRAYRTSISYKTYYCSSLKIQNAAGDTTAPTVSITSPTSGATVSGTVSVTATASDNVAVTKVEFYVDGALKSTDTTSPYAYSWDTTAYSAGSHTLKATAYDAANNNNYHQITVTVDNGGSGDHVLTSGTPATGSLASVGATETWTIVVAASCQTMYSVLTCGTADFDLYGKLGSAPTTSVYDWRGYTSGGEEVTFDMPGAGTWYIMVVSYSGTGAYTLTVTLTYSTPVTWGTGGKYAIIVGISDYGYINDLSYCDEDATDYYNQLTAMGYECHVYGDGHTANYPAYHGKATESVVRSAMQGLAAHAQAGNTVCFITSGHGSGDGAGSSYLCMWDCSGSAGCYYDTEIAADIGLFASGVNIFVFIDHCYSGGIGPELMALSIKSYIYCTTTCTANGYGYDDSSHLNGAWTYWFLEYAWQTYYSNVYHTAMESIYTIAKNNYPYTGGDAPMYFDGNTGTSFYLG